MQRTTIVAALVAALVGVGCASASRPADTAPVASPSSAATVSAGGSAAPSSDATIAASPAAASTSPSPASAEAVDVTIEDFAFTPATAEVPVGAIVRWRNRDGEPHSVRSDDGSIRSPLIVDEPFEWVAEGAPGTTIAYFCGVHPAMRGEIEIR